MSSPRIVIGMSVYNEAGHLAETIPAVLEQSMEDFHLLIVDNGSTDESYDMLRGAAEWSHRITVLRATRNLIPGAVANLLTHAATTLYPDCDWYLAHGADDLMAPDYLEAVLRAAEANPDANLIFSPWEYIDGAREPKRFPDFDPETCHAVHQIPAWSAMRRDLLLTAGPWEENLIAADWDWVVRNRYAIRAFQLDRPYIRLRVREGARVTQSEEVHWPTLHNRLCRIANKPIPGWAEGARAQC